MHVKCSPEVSRGDSLWYVVVEWVGHRLLVRLSVANLAVLFDTTLFMTEVWSLHNISVSRNIHSAPLLLVLKSTSLVSSFSIGNTGSALALLEAM
jgi:hypothetical protein